MPKVQVVKDLDFLRLFSIYEHSILLRIFSFGPRSAPEILLAIVGIVANGFQQDSLGPSLIVGSGAFNLLFLSAIRLGDLIIKTSTSCKNALHIFYHIFLNTIFIFSEGVMSKDENFHLFFISFPKVKLFVPTLIRHQVSAI